MRQVLFTISSLQSNKYRNMATQIDSQSKGKYKDTKIDSEEIKQFRTVVIDGYNSIKTDKRVASMGSEFSKELDDLMRIFNALPDEIKKVVKEEIKNNKQNKSQKLEELEKELSEKYEKLSIQCNAQMRGIQLTEEELKLPVEKIKLIVKAKENGVDYLTKKDYELPLDKFEMLVNMYINRANLMESLTTFPNGF